MRILLDVNVGTTIAIALREAGHDVIRTALLTPKAADPSILAWAVSDGRVLITYDSDFTDLIFRDQIPPPPALVYIREETLELKDLALRIVTLVGNGFLLDHIHVVDESDVRHRRFPGK